MPLQLSGGRILDALDPRPVEGDPELVHLDLERDHGGDQVVDVRCAGDEHCEGAVAVVVPAPPPAGCADLGPLAEGAESPLSENLG